MVYFGGFFPKLGHFAGFSLHIIYNAVRISEATMRGGGHYIFCVVFSLFIRRKDQRSCDGQDGGLGTKYDKYDNKRATVLHFRGLFQNWNFSLYINFAGRNSEAAMGEGENIFFRVQRSSIGCSVAQKGKA